MNVNLVNLLELENLVSLSEFQSKDVAYHVALNEKIRDAGIRTNLFFDVEHYDNSYHYRHAAIFLSDCEVDIQLQILKRETDKQFSIFSYKQYEYCDNSTCHEIKIKSGLIEPQGIGVLTSKKVEAHIHYQIALHKLYKERARENREKIETFIQSIKDLESTFPTLGAHDIYSDGVRWYKDNLSGWVKNNGLEFTFECHKGTGYISQRIKVSAANSLENFISLSNNKFTPEKY